MIAIVQIVLKKFVYNYVKTNFEKLSEKYYIDKKALIDIKKDRNNILEWILGEHLIENEFLDEGITIKTGWEDDAPVYSTIYKIGRRYVREIFVEGEYLDNHEYCFVKLKRKKIVVEEWMPIEK